MTTSQVLSKTAGNIIEEALRDARIIPSEQTVQAIDNAKGRTSLNNVVKYWQTQGIHLWRINRAVLPLDVGTRLYAVGPNGNNCGVEDTFYSTTLSADEASGQTVISVTANTGAAAASIIGIELDDGTRQWTTVASTGTGTITIDDALTGAAASGNSVFHYVEQVQRPLSIFNETYSSSFPGSEIPVDTWSRDEYMAQPLKTSTGTVTAVYYNPTLTSGKLYVWQTASNVKNVLRFDYREPLVTYGATGDTLEVPEEYFLPLKWAIAADVGPQYGVKPDRQGILEQKAYDHLQMALDNDAEEGSLFFTPGFD